MKEPATRTWTLDERIADFQRRGRIKTPFTPAERDLARNLAAAFYFMNTKASFRIERSNSQAKSAGATSCLPSTWEFKGSGTFVAS